MALLNVGAQQQVLGGPVRRRDRQAQRRAGVPEPLFIRIDPMPVRALPGLQQEEDCRSGRALPVGRSGAPRLPIPAAFGVRRQVQSGDQRPSIPLIVASHRFASNLIALETETWPVAAG